MVGHYELVHSQLLVAQMGSKMGRTFKMIHKDVYLIDVPKKGRFHLVFHVSVLKKFTPDKQGFYPDQIMRSKASYGVWDKKVDQVNGIVGKKRLTQRLVYQCTFEGFLVT